MEDLGTATATATTATAAATASVSERTFAAESRRRNFPSEPEASPGGPSETSGWVLQSGIVFLFVAVLRIQVVVVVAAFVWVLFVLFFIVVGSNRGGQWGAPPTT